MLAGAQLRAVLYVFIAAWSAISVVNGQPVSLAAAGSAQTAIGVVAALGLVFERWGWRFWPERLGGKPNIEGTWKGQIISDFRLPSGDQVPPIDAYLAIRQTFATVSVRQYTRESRSWLESGQVARDGDGTQTVSGIYMNEPQISLQERSRIHRGSFILVIEGPPTKSLRGHYWTDRNTTGQMIFEARSKKYHASFQDAETGHYE